MSEHEERAKQRYEAAGHAVQTGVAMDRELGSKDTEPKHLRTGVNLAMCDHAALVRLLIQRGVISEPEYFDAIAEEAEAEVKRYEARLTERTGARVKLL